LQIYDLNPDDSLWHQGIRYEIDAVHKWGLPGLKCPVCGATWATTGIEYPAVDLSSLPDEEVFRDGWPVPLAEFQRRQEEVRALAPPDAMLPPGADFGPSVGRASGQFTDLCWPARWTLFLTEHAL
jgi:uncharacterized double-CXXCG motif protein